MENIGFSETIKKKVIVNNKAIQVPSLSGSVTTPTAGSGITRQTDLHNLLAG